MTALRALALGGALMLAAGSFADAAETGTAIPVKASPLPVKALARAKRAARAPKWGWDPGIWATSERTSRPYTVEVARQHARSLWLDLAAISAVSIYVGIDQWGWGKTKFHFYNEGWFGKYTEYGGIDKLGHAWSAQVMSDHLTWRLSTMGFDTYQAAITAALITEVAFIGVEIGDGFSHFGFSYEDFLASSAGVAFSFLRSTVPGVAEKVDFRMQYIPTGHGDSLGLGDYSGKKFLLAWKLAGFEPFKDGPLRYLEIHTGYYTRGYNDWERARGIPLSRSPYVGVGLNVAEILFSHPDVRDTPVASVGRTLLRYIQVPYTDITTGSYP